MELGLEVLQGTDTRRIGWRRKIIFQDRDRYNSQVRKPAPRPRTLGWIINECGRSRATALCRHRYDSDIELWGRAGRLRE